MTTTTLPRRTGPIAEFPEATVTGIIDRLRAIFSREVAIAEFCLWFDQTGPSIPAGGSGQVDVLESRDVVDFADAGVDHFRVVAVADVAASTGITVSVYDLTNDRELARVALQAGAGEKVAAGPWTTVPLKGTDATIVVRVLFASGGSVKLYAVRLQARTSKIVT